MVERLGFVDSTIEIYDKSFYDMNSRLSCVYIGIQKYLEYHIERYIRHIENVCSKSGLENTI
jgi:hypothetical protein